MSKFVIESLESRKLLAGVTLLTTGRMGGLSGWMQTMANYITARLGGPSQVPQYILKITPAADGHLIAQPTHVSGSATPQGGGSGEIVIDVDYQAISTDNNYPLTMIAGVMANFMMNTSLDGVLLAQLPIHGIGVSRGTGLLDELAKALGKSGVWVDQESYLDPLPVAAQGDAPPTIYDNVAFVDNYWRSDGNPNNYNGSPVNGAYNLNVQWLDSENSGFGLPHLVPAGYYNGTIDLNATWAGEGPIHTSWYDQPPVKPPRDQIGFYFSNIVGGPRPLSGIWSASGGSGSRTATGQSGSQWPSITDVAIAGGNTFAAGQNIQINYLQQDRDSSSNVAFYLDPDRNPYNNNFAHVLGGANLTLSNSIASGQTSGTTDGVAPGTYWIAAKISDGQGHWRFAYSKPVNITGPTTYLSDLTPTSATNGWGPYEKDHSNGEQAANDGHILTLNGATYTKGIGVHAPSDISFNLNKQYATFISDIGIDDEISTTGSVNFQVWLDGVKAFDSGLMKNNSPTQNISMNVAGVTTLRLVVTDGGNGNGSDHADWAGARLFQATAVTPPTAPTLQNPSATPNQVTLSWTQPLSNQIGFQIERKTGTNGAYSTIANLDASAVGYLDTTVAAGTTYYYRVTAYNTGGKSVPSNEVSASVPSQSQFAYLSDLTPTSTSNGWGPYEKNQSNGESATNDGHTITLNGQTYARGLGVHAASTLIYNISGNSYTQFLSDIGVDDEVGANGNVDFQVFLDNVQVYDSGTMTGATATKSVAIDVTGKSQLKLVIPVVGSSNAYDHADWAGARLIAGQPVLPPAVPTLASPTVVNQQVNLSWTEPASNQSGFRIERKAGANGTYTQIADVDAGTLGFNDTNVSGGTTYYYHVYAYNSGGSSALSNEVNATVTVQPTTYLSGLTPISATNGWGPYEKDQSNGEQGANDGHTITLNGMTYAKGLGVHASSDISFNLNKQYTTFLSDIGVDDEQGTAGSVVFQVYLDGVKAFDSGLMSNSSTTQTVNLNVTGVTTLRLAVTDGGNGNGSDHADWAGARLIAGQPPALPAAPTGLAAVYNSTTGKVDLNWTDTSGDQTGFRVERKLGAGGTYAPVQALSGSTFNWSDPGPFAGSSTYFYRVFATNAGGDSLPSSEQSIATPVGSTTTYLSDLTPTSATNGWGPYEKDHSNGETGASDGHTMALNGITYARGLGVHAISDISFNLNSQYTSFISDIGVDDEQGNAGSVVFQVYLDGVKVLDSGVMTNSSTTQAVNLSVVGKNSLRLLVTDAGDGNGSDHADWAGARLLS